MKTIAFAAALLLVSAAAALGSTGSRVTLGDLSPVVVVGSGFGDGNIVHVTVSAGGRRLVKAVRSTDHGTFRAAWAVSLPDDTCGPLIVTAVSGERRAAWKRVTSCAPPVPTP